MNSIIDFIFNASIPTLYSLIAGIIILLLIFIHCSSSLSDETYLENFDNHTIGYGTFLLLTEIPLTLLLLYRYSSVTFYIVIVLLCTIFSPRGRRRGIFNKRYEFHQNIIGQSIITRYFTQRQRRINRRIALKAAKDFLRPYKHIFGKHTLSNKFCNITYVTDKKQPKFICLNTQPTEDGKYQFFEVFTTYEFDYDNFFNSICLNFSYDINFNILHTLFSTDNLTIIYTNCSKNDFKRQQKKINEKKYIWDDYSKTIKKSHKTVKQKDQRKMSEEDLHPHSTLNTIRVKEEEILERINKEKEEEQKYMVSDANKININEASEAEITALPGINIVQAKRIIKHRNLNGNFKSVEDFLNYIKVKQHFAMQLKYLVTTASDTLIIDLKQKSDERIIDLD